MKTIKMKTMTNFKLLFFVAALLVAFTSCNKDKNGGGDSPGNGTISAKINGGSLVKFNKNVTAGKALGLIAFSGDDDNGNRLSLVLPGDISTGTYDLGDDNTDIVVMYIEGDGDGNGYFATSGELKITKHNEGSNTVKGTFHFEGSNFASTVNVTDGEFDIKYKEAK